MNPDRDRLLALAALHVEAIALRAGATRARVVRTGTGPRRASAAATRLIDDASARRCGAVAVVGVCGALDPTLQPGDLIVADSVLDSSGNLVAELPAAALLAQGLRGHGMRVRVGPILSGDRIVSGSAARAAMVARGAVAGRSPL
ncbi:MAG: 4-hydroxy-3-methylbut-2-enyl diphosphate reductase, partial [Acidimicrobiales bacterium]